MAIKPTSAEVAGMADLMHRQRCWRGPWCPDYTTEDWNFATALWWFLRGMAS